MSMRSRRAFVLIAVLWITAAVMTMAGGLSMVLREDGAIAQNHLDLERARWSAEGCAERSLAAADAALELAEITDSVWFALDSVLAQSPLLTGCMVRSEPVGNRANVNLLDRAELERIFIRRGSGALRAESLATAILNWRDADRESPSAIAERDWYATHGRVAPRHGPFASLKELHLVRGLERERWIDSTFATEGRPLLLGRASLVVLAALDGMSPEAVGVIARMRAQGKRVIRLEEVVSRLGPEARTEAVAHYPTLLIKTAAAPAQWRISASGAAGEPALYARVDMTLITSGRRVLVTSYQSTQ